MSSEYGKKRKLQSTTHSSNHNHEPPTKQLKTSKPSATFKPTGGRDYTVSLAIPGSIIANALTHDAKTTLASTIARCAAVFCIDEIVVFDDGTNSHQDKERAESDVASGYTAYTDPNHFLAHVLSYLETPPNLRRRLFPHHPNLKTAGSMPSLDMPHHMKKEDRSRWREGVVLESRSGDAAAYSVVDVGLEKRVRVSASIPEGARVTIDLATSGKESADEEGLLRATAVAPSEPREVEGYYWGYVVRRAESLSSVLTESTFDGGYDFCVGTSERGEALEEFTRKESRGWKHLLLCLGGIAGLEAAVQNDPELRGKGVTEPSVLFDAWINLVPRQGSRTIRTEEAVWCGCMGFKPWVDRSAVGPPGEVGMEEAPSNAERQGADQGKTGRLAAQMKEKTKKKKRRRSN